MNRMSFRNHFVKLLPNAVTILIVAMMLFAFRAYAMPDSPLAADESIGKVSYQGQLMGADGEPVDGDVDITFKLYSVPSGGEALWTEAHTGANAVPVEDGLFHVFLGSLNPILAGVWSNDMVYLGIAVEGDPEMTPREAVGRVAYALAADRAITADRAYGLSAADGDPRDAVLMSDNGNLMIPNGGMCIDSDGACSSPGAGGLRIGETGIHGTDAGGSNVLLVPTTGKVGIGIPIGNEPQDTLDVDGNVRLSGHLKPGVKPIHAKRFLNIPSNTYFATGISSEDYFCAIVGAWTDNQGDIWEIGNHTLMKLRMDVGPSGGWDIMVDFITHNTHESWNVDVLCTNNHFTNWDPSAYQH